jgi:hypothetical protein
MTGLHHRDRDAHRELSETPKTTPRRRRTDKPDYLFPFCIFIAGFAMFYGFTVLIDTVVHFAQWRLAP